MGPGTRAELACASDWADEFAAAAEWVTHRLARTASSAPVPSCPDWTVLDLATHLGNVHSWAASVLETGRAANGLHDEPGSHRPRKVARWYQGRAEDLYAVLRDTPLDRPCWNFTFGAGVAGFWHRRMVHETHMHGVDLAHAGDHEERLPVHVAVDGVDEALTVFLHRMHNRGHPAELDAPLVLRATDADAAWTVEPAPRGGGIPVQPSAPEGRVDGTDRAEPIVVREDTDGVDAVEAPAGVLLKVLWKRTRVSDPRLRICGDASRVGRFLASRLTP